MRQIHPDSVVGRYREEIKAIAADNGLRNVRLFGSRARGDHKRHSDVDLLVGEPPDGSGLAPLCKLAIHIEKLTGKSVDVATESMLSPVVRAEVMREAIPL